MTEPLRAEHTVEFSYRRSVGGAVEEFLLGLRRGEIWGSVAADGRVNVPPTDLDDHLVQVADLGTVRSWTWVETPGDDQSHDKPFAFALIQLDGSDTSLVHRVEVEDETQVAAGLRVRAVWRTDRIGSIDDISAFVPGEVSEPASPLSGDQEPVEVRTELALDYAYEPGLTLSGFLRALGERRIEGGRCLTCDQVYVPPRSRCPVCGRGPMSLIDVGDAGTIVSYTVVHVPPHGASPELPFAWAWIRLDEADVPFPHLLGDVVIADLAVGQRVRAEWVEDSDLGATWASIRHFAVVGQ